jgi:transposase InsO family protein
LAGIAHCSRRTAGARRQYVRRAREATARQRFVAFSEAAHAAGWASTQVATDLQVPVRTLTRWRQRLQDPRQQLMPPRGRPCVTSSPAARSAVLDLLEDTGPRLGLPTLRRVFPELRRCELLDLEHDYRQAFRQSHRISREVLTWHVPRRVWAMDHARPPQPIDGRYSSILSVRDLGSGRQLAWLPVPDETEGTTCAALEALFAEYGAPLVLKSDNGSAFRSGLLGDLLTQHGVTALFSPAVTPRYNGGCEAGNGAMKLRTHEQAALAGRAGRWTSEDLEAARRHANETYVPDTDTTRTAEEIWNSAPPMDDQERQAFQQCVQHIESTLREVLSTTDTLPATRHERAALERRVIRRALVESGLLSITRRLISLPLKRRKLAKIF